MRSLSSTFVALALAISLVQATPSMRSPMRRAPKVKRDGSFTGVETGDLTYYDTGLTACGQTYTDSDLIAAISEDMFDTYPGYAGTNPNNNPVCGSTAVIYNPATQKSVQVTVVDRCTGCAWGDIDVTPTAFSQIADMNGGRIHNIQWQFGTTSPGDSSGGSSSSTTVASSSTEASSTVVQSSSPEVSSTPAPTTTTTVTSSSTESSSTVAPTTTEEPCADETSSETVPTTTEDPCSEETSTPVPTSTEDPCAEETGSSTSNPATSTSANASTSTSTSSSGSTSGASSFDSTAVYTGGQSVCYNGTKYTAKWWTQGETPSSTSDVWTAGGSC